MRSTGERHGSQGTGSTALYRAAGCVCRRREGRREREAIRRIVEAMSGEINSAAVHQDAFAGLVGVAKQLQSKYLTAIRERASNRDGGAVRQSLRQGVASQPTGCSLTADAGYRGEADVEKRMHRRIPALIADNQMRQRDERSREQGKHRAEEHALCDKQVIRQTRVAKRLAPRDLRFERDTMPTCGAGKTLGSNGCRYTMREPALPDLHR
jgi:hypothetical protein